MVIWVLSAATATLIAGLYYFLDKKKEEIKSHFFDSKIQLDQLDQKVRTLDLELKSLKKKTETLQNQTNDLFLAKTRKKKV